MTTMNEVHEREKRNAAIKCTDKDCSAYNATTKTRCCHSLPYYCDRAKAHKIREAAPELLEACKSMLTLIRADKHLDIYFNAQAAIEKAEGSK